MSCLVRPKGEPDFACLLSPRSGTLRRADARTVRKTHCGWNLLIDLCPYAPGAVRRGRSARGLDRWEHLYATAPFKAAQVL